VFAFKSKNTTSLKIALVTMQRWSANFRH